MTERDAQVDPQQHSNDDISCGVPMTPAIQILGKLTDAHEVILDINEAFYVMDAAISGMDRESGLLGKKMRSLRTHLNIIKRHQDDMERLYNKQPA
ncbi:hypothetical protein [Geminicoccus flavidas]|uniref:hypothetical protein n=1 Tax=Geminicoccus flavidas TaxID=2506407 RepID=UPI00135767EB|nr:hypothetical protein [Geminicoccus flavidas]